MRKSLISIILVLIVLLAISLVGCSKNDNNSKDIIGYWKNDTTLPGYEFIYTFNENGTGNYNSAGTDMPFQYVISGNKISIFYDGDDVPFDTEFEIKGNVLNVKDSNNEDVFYNRISENEAKSSSSKSDDVPVENSDIYENVIADYKNAVAEYDLEDIDSDSKLMENYPLVNSSIIMHIARYSDEGVKLTYAFYDVNKDGIDELLVGAGNSCGAIYSYNKNSDKLVKIHFLDTMERGNLSIYDNGIIITDGAGGAAIHYYEYGKISEGTTSYEELEAVIEEYVDGSEIPIYKKYDTEEVLDYKSLTEINDKYISNAKVIDNINFIELAKSKPTGTAGSNIPLKDNHDEAEYQIKLAFQDQIKKAFGDSVVDVKIYVEKIYTAEEEQEDEALKEKNLGPNEIAFEVKYELKPAEGTDVNALTAATGVYDEQTGWVKEKYNLGILRPTINEEALYRVTDVGTGW